MAQTPLSTSTPYATTSDLFDYHDSNQVGDFIAQGSAPRPSLASMLDATSAAGKLLTRFGLLASGRIESTCLIGKRYTPADLQALLATATASRESLVKLCCDLMFWYCAQRKQPGTADPKNVPGALEALEMLKALRDGEAIFGFAESADAGLPAVVQAQPTQLLTPNVLCKARRLFPLQYPNILDGSGD